jgi:glycosyltransferase involved in cell wall biosynthesis
VTADVDVVIPVRNAGRWLRRAVESVLEQEDVQVRVVVVDDGSTDSAPQRLPKDPRLCLVSGPARGIPRALNAGLEACRAPYIARQDADDESLPGRLAAQATFLEANPGIGLAATGFEVVVGQRVISATRTLPTRMLDKNPICAGSTVVRRTVLDAVGGYRPVFVFSSDYDMWLRCAAVAGVSILPMLGYRYRLSADMTTVRNASRQAAYAELARASARARILGVADPADHAGDLHGDAASDADVAAWWAREFAALGSWHDAAMCLVRLPLPRAARLLPHMLRRPASQVGWS